MRICYICADSGIPIMGRKGCSTHVRETTRALMDAGHEVFIISPNRGGDVEGNGNIDILEIPPYTPKWLGSDLRHFLYNRRLNSTFPRIYRQRRPDVIYERYSLYSTAGLNLSRRYRLPRILEVNSFLVQEQLTRLHFPNLARRIENQLLLSADFIIVVSEPLRQAFIKAGVPENRITIMPMAVDVNVFRPEVEAIDLRRLIDAGPESTLVGYVGTLTGWHGIDLLFEITRILKKRDIPVHVVVIGGDTVKVEQNRQLARDQQLGDRLHFLGSVSYQDVPRYLNGLDVTLISGSHEWASPTKLFEYQAMGKPSIAPRLMPIAEAMTDGEEGFLFDPKNASQVVNQIIALHDDPRLRRSMGNKARAKVVRTHSWECNTGRIIEIFNSMLAKQNRDGH